MAQLKNSINTVINGYDEFQKYGEEIILEAPIAIGQPGKTQSSISLWQHFIQGFGDGYKVMKGKLSLKDLATKLITQFESIQSVDVGNEDQLSGKNINFAILIVCIIFVVKLLFFSNNYFME